jgi:hypothetical protein
MRVKKTTPPLWGTVTPVPNTPKGAKTQDKQTSCVKTTIKKQKVNNLKANHYISKDALTQKLIEFRKNRIKLRYFIINKKSDVLIDHYTEVLKKLRNDLIMFYIKACRKLLNTTEFRYNDIDTKDDMVSYAVFRMLKYDYFYKFDETKSKEGFSWFTTIIKNWFYEFGNLEVKQKGIKYGVLRHYKHELENNQAMDLSDLSQASVVKGIKMTFHEFKEDNE